jgi:hypothetical protein
VSRKGELSSAAIDKGWPHQVAVPADTVRGANYPPTHDRAAFRSLCDRGHSFFRDDRHYVVLCFAERADAAHFMERFGGDLIDPKDRPRWGGGTTR